jgi:cytidine deaminase
VIKAIASGERDFEAIAIVGNTSEPITPCGICRQNLIEFGEDILVIMVNARGDAMTASVKDLLPRAFTSRCLK